MSSATVRAKEQIVITWKSPRRLTMITLCLTVIMSLLVVVSLDFLAKANVQFDSPIQPVGWESGYCPGDILSFPVNVKTNIPDDGNAVYEITESWHMIGGSVSILNARDYKLPGRKSLEFSSDAKVVIPANLPLGRTYEIWHVTTTWTERGIEGMTGYTVGPIMLREDCAP